MLIFDSTYKLKWMCNNPKQTKIEKQLKIKQLSKLYYKYVQI